MKDITLITSSLKSRWLNSALSVLLTAFGVTLAVIILQFGHHIHNRMSNDGKGIDIVVGAKGSPLQLILSSVYHIDIPTGNIAYKDAKKWMKHPKVKTAIPLALGDNWKGYRIVGTTPDYMTHYNADISKGRHWNKSFEVVIGADIPLGLGKEISGAHGLSQGGHIHENEHYTVVGRLSKTGSVLDRLILTSLDSVLEIHGLEAVESHDLDHEETPHEGHDHTARHKEEKHEDHEEHEDHHNHGGHDDHEDHDGDKHEDHKDDDHKGHDHEQHEEAGEPEITALLLTTRSPIANMNLPRIINRDTALQAANPALEMARLTSMLGLGAKTFSALSALLITIAALNIFAGLAGSLENRMGDLAVLRAIGYSQKRIFKIIVTEGMVIVIIGLILGLIFGMYGFMTLTNILNPLAASSAKLQMTNEIIWIIISVTLAGFLASALPAIRASRVNIAKQLTRAN
ncbi:MAG: ABC transporter permease [Alphaproteobacteria bacterium]|nr:MAG: ABC transporter permease [Alphaproteobacteria bacterium]